jgi:hypothetical protein
MTGFSLLAALVVFVGQPVAMSQGDMVQAVKQVCSPSAHSRIVNGPVCSGLGPMEAQPICHCPKMGDILVDHPACNPDGSPAMFPREHRLTKQESDKLRICRM